MEKLNMKVNKVAYHRNGSFGNSFHVVTFGNDGHNMVGIVFDESYSVAVLDVDMLAQGKITMDEDNTWRGDLFEPQLRDAVEKYEVGRAKEYANV